nr:uncharacterized protein LOC100142642 isoform X2 [Danio rerio]|eukprot:XP_021325230.1 uncharacterized protein LOC100142642 isoform X2 [Danio rerio]
MKRTSIFILILLLMWSVFAATADEVKAVTVTEGDSVTLNPRQGLKEIDLLLWRFGDKGSTIAQINENNISYPNYTEIFKGRLKLNQTGSLTINNTRAKHSGLYILHIDHSGGKLVMNFVVTVNEPSPLIDAPEAEMMHVSVKEGYPVTLHTDVPQLHGDELIVWRFGDKEKLMAIDDKEIKSKKIYDTDERFRHRLELIDLTGSLIINNMKYTDAGLYTVKISSNKQILYKKFFVTVSGSGLSSGAVAGIVVLLLLVAVAAVLGFLYYRNKNSKLQKRLDGVYQTASGGDVTIKPETKLHPGDEIQWWFWNELSPIAGFKDGKIFTSNNPKWKGRDRLKLDKKTGSLTINNIGRKLTGKYTLEIIRGSGENIRRTFTVLITDNKIAAQKGASQTLKPDTEIQRDDEIQWLLGNKNDLIAKMTGVTRKITYPDERFKDRLELDKKTGSLTINNITFKHTGVFKMKISSWRRNKIQVFIVYIPRERFKETLVLDKKTGSLIIKNGRPAHSGRYCLQIKNSTGAPIRAFNVVFHSPAENQEPALLPEEQKLLPRDFEDIVYANERTSPV